MTGIAPQLLERLVDPVDKSPLVYKGGLLRSAGGRSYPVVQGIPMMLIGDVQQTLGAAEESLKVQNDPATQRDAWQLETVGISDVERRELREMIASPAREQVDPVVSYLVAATNGILYRHLIGNLKEYTIPEIRLPRPMDKSEWLLDIGSSWGRWSMAAARKGYTPVALDPSLGAVLAGQRVAKQLGLTVHGVVGDARYLPFRDQSFVKVFSYSVLQHFSKQDARTVLRETGRVLTCDGSSLIQMPNAFGLRSVYHLVRRGFSEGRAFDVRYYTPKELLRTFRSAIGPSKLSVDGYFGLGIQASDWKWMGPKQRFVLATSETLRRIADVVMPVRFVADSVYLESKKPA